METQDAQVLESIQSFGQETAAEAIKPAKVHHAPDQASDNSLGCFCEVLVRSSILMAKFFSAYCNSRQKMIYCSAKAGVKNGSTFGLYIILFFASTYLSLFHFIGVWGTHTILQRYPKF